MSLYAYKVSQEISRHPFDAIIMAAMRNADDMNLEWLKNGFPDIYKELKARYYAPGGILEHEKEFL
jgi:hypothetical protein